MAERCVNGHDTPRGQACMYCGGPLLPPVAAPPLAYGVGGPPRQEAPRPPEEFSVLGAVALAFSLLFPIGSIIGVVLALIALSRIRARRQNGRGVAVAGLIIGSLGVVLMLVAGAVVLVTDATSKSDTMTACTAESAVIVTASNAWNASGEHETLWPTSIEELVDAGYLQKQGEFYAIEGDGNSPPTYRTLDGQCEGVPVPN